MKRKCRNLDWLLNTLVAICKLIALPNRNRSVTANMKLVILGEKCDKLLWQYLVHIAHSNASITSRRHAPNMLTNACQLVAKKLLCTNVLHVAGSSSSLWRNTTHVVISVLKLYRNIYKQKFVDLKSKDFSGNLTNRKKWNWTMTLMYFLMSLEMFNYFQ